jgi:hypothetical protein
MGISRWVIIALVVDHTENTKFRVLLRSGWETSNLHQHCQVTASARAIVTLVLGRDTRNTDMFRSPDRILWQVAWLIPAAVTSSTVWEQLAHTNNATSWILSSVPIVLDRPVAHSLLCQCEPWLLHSTLEFSSDCSWPTGSSLPPVPLWTMASSQYTWVQFWLFLTDR